MTSQGRNSGRASPPVHPNRRRSRSPRRDDRTSSHRSRDDEDRDSRKRTKKPGGGFKFKEKSRRDDDEPEEDRQGYRDRARSPRRDYDRDGDRDRDRLAAVTKTDAQREADAAAAEKEERRRRRKEKKAAAAAAGPTAGEEMIIVSVNDRLGTKSQIPCFASDTIGQFKVMVAARIGREKHEIMLKRQGERPFKDHITLGDYGISNGVQIDLEMDTGD